MKQRLLRATVQTERAFFATQAVRGVVLIVASLAAMVLANSRHVATYFGLVHHQFGPLSIGHWINDGLMALFFLLIGPFYPL